MEASKEVQPEAGSGHGSSNRSSYLCRQSSTRWIPTAEQIRILKELYYNNGLRSPTAEQIQRISARLRQYGKIEGKNVFYWFQNHKARERQKKRLGAAAQRTTATTSSVAVSDYLWSSYGDSASNSTSIINTNVGTGQECRRSCGSWMTESGHLLDSSSLGRDGFMSPGSSCTSETGTDSHGIFDPGDLDGVADRSTRIVETLELFPLRGGDGSGTGSERSRIGETYPALCFGEGGSEPVSSLELTLSSFAGGDGGMRNPGSGHTFLPSGS